MSRTLKKFRDMASKAMACRTCNDGKAWEDHQMDEVTWPQLEKSARKCKVCTILLQTLQEQGFGKTDILRISTDTDTNHSRCMHGINVYISQDGVSNTAHEFLLRNSHGECFS